MADNFVLPVKLLLKALNSGNKLAENVLASTSTVSTEKALQISELVPLLQKSLERGSQAVCDVYSHSAGACGDTFAQALSEDQTTKRRLDKLRNQLRDTIDENENEEFDPDAFRALTKQVEQTCLEYVQIFNSVRDQLRQSQPPPQLDVPDDRASLPSSNIQYSSPSKRKPVPSPNQRAESLHSSTLLDPLPIVESNIQLSKSEPVKPPHSPWAINSAAQFNTGPALAPATSPIHRRDSRDVSPSTTPDGQPRLISKDIVNFRISANEEWLAKRRESRLLFQNEFRSVSRASFASIDEHKASNAFDDGLMVSPGGHSPISPLENRTPRTSLNGYDTLMSRERSQGVQSRGSRTSSILHEQQQRPPAQRQESQDSIFGLRAAPLSPPLTDPRNSGPFDLWNQASPPFITPGFGAGVEDGMEVVANNNLNEYTGSQFEDGLIAVVGGQEVHFNQPTTPSLSVKSIDCPIRSEASFYKLKGFCDGAKAVLNGETGFKVVKRPSGHYSATVSARCIKCSYEVGWNDVEKDRLLDRGGIYGNSGIRWRQKFLSKCHIRTDSIESPAYACIFCIEEHKTLEEHDATVFFSVVQLFRHLATHPRPLRNIPGLTVLYGQQPPSVLDFDIHFVHMEPTLHPFRMAEISQKVATRPSAHAIQTFHPKNGHKFSRDPSGGNVLHFATGARIVAITFPPEFGGTWCVGYHDGERGAFPASHIALEKPDRRDYLMDDRSTLVAYAKWDFKPTGGSSSGTDWLQLRKGEKISCIGYTFMDNWCYSGRTPKGFGLFPQAFVENCHTDTTPAGSPGLQKSSTRFMGKFSMSLGRNKSARHDRPSQDERHASVASNGSNGSGGISVRGQPGLEVVASPVHGSNAWRT